MHGRRWRQGHACLALAPPLQHHPAAQHRRGPRGGISTTLQPGGAGHGGQGWPMASATAGARCTGTLRPGQSNASHGRGFGGWEEGGCRWQGDGCGSMKAPSSVHSLCTYTAERDLLRLLFVASLCCVHGGAGPNLVLGSAPCWLHSTMHAVARCRTQPIPSWPLCPLDNVVHVHGSARQASARG